MCCLFGRGFESLQLHNPGKKRHLKKCLFLLPIHFKKNTKFPVEKPSYIDIVYLYSNRFISGTIPLTVYVEKLF